MRKAEIKQSMIPEFISGSSTPVVSQQQQKSKTLNQVQGLSNFNNFPLYPQREDRTHIPGKRTYVHGFTLIEILVVILIIGILATVAFIQYNRIKLRTIFNIAASTTREIYEAQRLFYLEKGRYASSFEELPIKITGSQVYQGKRVECNPNYYGPCCFIWKGNNPFNPQHEVWILYSFSGNEKGRLYCDVYPQADPIYKSFCSKLTGDPTGTDGGYAWIYKGPVQKY